MDESAPRLETAARIGLIGDLHGVVKDATRALDTLRDKGISVVCQLGDFGFPWPRTRWVQELGALDARLAANGQTLYFVEGNHDWFPKLHDYPVSADGLAWLRPRIAHMRRGWRTTLSNGMVIAGLGGAGSVDRYQRTEGTRWWAEEVIRDADLEALGTTPVDILLAHDAPSGNRYLARALAKNASQWSPEGLEHARKAQSQFQRGFEAVAPRWCFSGHYHGYFRDTVLTETADGGAFATQSIVLDMASNASGGCLATLDLATMSVQIHDRAGGTYALTGTEGGRWRVRTQGSVHILDLDEFTVRRYRGPDGNDLGPYNGEDTRKLRTFERCAVGHIGYWTLEPSTPHVEFEWHRTSTIRTIEPIQPGEPDLPDGIRRKP